MASLCERKVKILGFHLNIIYPCATKLKERLTISYTEILYEKTALGFF
jgi:hypothetical protein